jgi:hypothetical protein
MPTTLSRPMKREEGYHKYQLTFTNELSDHDEGIGAGTHIFTAYLSSLASHGYLTFTDECRVYQVRWINWTERIRAPQNYTKIANFHQGRILPSVQSCCLSFSHFADLICTQKHCVCGITASRRPILFFPRYQQ